MIKKNYLLSIGTIIFSLFFLYETFQMNVIGSSFYISSRGWPGFMLIGMLVLGIIMLIRTYLQSKNIIATEPQVDSESESDEGVIESTSIDEEIGTEEESDEDKPIRKLFNIPMSIISMGILGVYLFLMTIVGFIISTLIFVTFMSILLGMKNKTLAFVLALISTAVLVFVFPQLLAIPLPRGLGVFYEFSLLFY